MENSKLKDLRSRLTIWLLRRMVRVAQSHWFELLLRRLIRLAFYYTVFALMFDRLPKSVVEANPATAQMVAKIRAQLDTRVADVLNTEANRTLGQATTWGLAGVGVIMLTAIITAHISNPAFELGVALWAATVCFSFSVPVLIMLGFVYLAQSEATKLPPTVRQVLTLNSSIWVAQFVFCVGFVAFLWSYEAPVSIIFLIGCAWAWRRFRKFAVQYNASQPNRIKANDMDT